MYIQYNYYDWQDVRENKYLIQYGRFVVKPYVLKFIFEEKINLFLLILEEC